MKITTRKSVDYRVDIPVTAWYQCDNCGHKEKVTEHIDNEEMYWVLSGEKSNADKDCSLCGDTLLIMPLKQVEKDSEYGDKSITAPDIVLDITEYQDIR